MVLVVDDDAAFRDLAKRILIGCGYRVIGEAGGVAEAMRRAAEMRPDTVLVDIGLPDGDGFDLTEQLVAMPWPIRVVLISSHGDRATEKEASRVGASTFLPKHKLSAQTLQTLIEGG